MPNALERAPSTKISAHDRQPTHKALLVDLARLEREYFDRRPDLSDPNQMVNFRTSGHNGSPLAGTFTGAHILAITQAICDYRRTDGPLCNVWARIRRRCPRRAMYGARGPGDKRCGNHYSAKAML
jgi:hypothetical protein